MGEFCVPLRQVGLCLHLVDDLLAEGQCVVLFDNDLFAEGQCFYTHTLVLLYCNGILSVKGQVQSCAHTTRQ